MKVSRRNLLLGATASAVLSGGWFPHGTATQQWSLLKQGAGGQITGIDIAPDGTMVIRGDGGGCSIWDTGLSAWRQLITVQTMPASFVWVSEGGWECKVAYSKTTRIYLIENTGFLYRSDDSGWSFIKTNMPKLTGSVFTTSGTNTSPQKFFQGKMIVDPNNADIVYVSNSDGIRFTNNAGSTWATISTGYVPAPSSSWSSGMAFDTSGGTVTVGGQVRTANVILTSYGNGIYLSQTGGGSEATDWAAIGLGGPVDVYCTTVDPNGPCYYCSDNASTKTLQSYRSGSWTTIISNIGSLGNFPVPVVDPATAGRMLLCDGQGGYLYTNYGGTRLPASGSGWNSIYPSPGVQPNMPSDIPWLAATRTGSAGSIFLGGAAQINPIDGTIYITDGIGVWKGAWPTTFVAFNLTSQSVGIEELVSNDIIAPAGGNVLIANWDRPIFTIPKSLPATYAASYGPENALFNNCWGLDYASSNPDFICARVYFSIQSPLDSSAYSTDKGVTWTLFSTTPASTAQNGSIAAATDQNIVQISGAGQQLYNTKDRGATWNQPASVTQTTWITGNSLCTHVLAADRVNIGTFYAFDYASGTSELWVSTDGGDTWAGYVATAVNAGGGFNQRLRAAPGNAGHLWFTTGPQGASSPGTPPEGPGISPPNTFLWRCTDGGVSGNSSWQAIRIANGYGADVKGIIDFGFGAIAPGATYPTIYIIGYVSSTFGVFRSTDGAMTWTNMGWPNVIDFPKVISGDMDDWQTCYMGMSSGSWVCRLG